MPSWGPGPDIGHGAEADLFLSNGHRPKLYVGALVGTPGHFTVSAGPLINGHGAHTVDLAAKANVRLMSLGKAHASVTGMAATNGQFLFGLRFGLGTEE